MPPHAALSRKACVAIYVDNLCDLDLYPIDRKINREHLLSMTNVCMKFQKAGPNQILVIDLTRKYDGRTDRETDRQVKSNIPLFFEGGHKNGTKLCQKYFIVSECLLHGVPF